MWIDIEYKKTYKESPLRGLRLSSSKKTNSTLRLECFKFCKWLRKHYWFPIRVRVHLLSYEDFCTFDTERKTAIFWYPLTWDEKPNEKRNNPVVYIATGKYEKRSKRHGTKDTLCNYFFDIVHELTHYFQWYFYEFDKRTDRSLEIEANRWGYWLVSQYISEIEQMN